MILQSWMAPKRAYKEVWESPVRFDDFLWLYNRNRCIYKNYFIQFKVVMMLWLRCGCLSQITSTFFFSVYIYKKTLLLVVNNDYWTALRTTCAKWQTCSYTRHIHYARTATIYNIIYGVYPLVYIKKNVTKTEINNICNTPSNLI